MTVAGRFFPVTLSSISQTMRQNLVTSRRLGDEFVHPSMGRLQISPNGTLNLFELGLSAPDVSRVTLLDLPPSNPALTTGWSRFATKVDTSTVTRPKVDIITTRGVDDSWRALLAPSVGDQHLVVPDSKHDRASSVRYCPSPRTTTQALVTSLIHIEMIRSHANPL